MGTQPILRPPTRRARMSRAHFELIAWTIRNLVGDHQRRQNPLEIGCAPECPACVRYRVAHRFACELANTNPRFNQDRFLRACEAAS